MKVFKIVISIKFEMTNLFYTTLDPKQIDTVKGLTNRLKLTQNLFISLLFQRWLSKIFI